MPGLFRNMIERLRTHEEIMLYDNVLLVSEEENGSSVEYLNSEYLRESTSYPAGSPEFNGAAALWGAKTTYIAAQLILYRQHETADLSMLLPTFGGEKDAGALLSADLCLRFLPGMIQQLSVIDSADPLIVILHSILREWHYSAIGADDLNPIELDFGYVGKNVALLQLYCERIVAYRKINWASIPLFNERISAEFGMYGLEFWKDFKKNI